LKKILKEFIQTFFKEKSLNKGKIKDNIESYELLELLSKIEERVILLESEFYYNRKNLEKIVESVNKLSKGFLIMQKKLEEIDDIEIVYEDSRENIKNFLLEASEETSITSEELIKQITKLNKGTKELEEFEKELEKNKDKITPGQVGES
tara:strand:- start:398 stop:847 length:450 start_codon:yes stop_codon:yes gene_type:complete